MSTMASAACRYPSSVVRQTVTASDGIRLPSFVFGAEHPRTLLFVMPIGLEVRIVAPLANALSTRYRFISWETRLSPGLDGEPSEAACAVEAHLRDLSDVLAHYQVGEPFALFAWCSSAQLAIRYARRHPERLSSLVLLSPYLRGVTEDSERRARNRKIYQRITKKPHFAEVLVQEMQRTLEASPEAIAREYQTDIPEVVEIISKPALRADAFRRYAAVMNALEQAPPIDLDEQLPVPQLIVSGQNDGLASPDIAAAVAERQRSARLLIDRDGDHYIPVRPQRIIDGIASFLHEAQWARSAS